MKRLILLLSFLLLSNLAYAQGPMKLCIPTSSANSNCVVVYSGNPLPVTGSLSITFPTIGAAVPATGLYNALNVAGTLRGLSGLSTGSLFPAAVAIVDASGTQITSFGSSASVAATGGAVPASANYVGINVGGTLTGWTGAVSQSGTWNITNVSGTVSLPTGASSAANQSTIISSLATIATNTGAAIPAGTALIGKVGIDQTTVGTTNAISLAQIGTTTVATGNGVVGTGVQRVSIASDNTAFAVNNTSQAGTANIGNVGGTSNVTPTDCSGTITSGGTAQNAHTAQSTLRGMTIGNLDATEVMWISFTGTATASAVGSYPLAPATATTFAGFSSYTTPIGFGYSTALSVNALTTGHKFSCTRW